MSEFTARLCGRQIAVECVKQRRKTLRFEVTGREALRVYCPTTCSRAVVQETLRQHQQAVEALLLDWREPLPAPALTPRERASWAKAAQKKTQPVVDRCVLETGLYPSYVKLKEQRSIWGSCTGKKGVNLNIRLAYCPPEILRYVVIHELCHLRQPNHSAAFWQLVAEHDPAYKAHRDYLRRHGRQILALPLGLPLDPPPIIN